MPKYLDTRDFRFTRSSDSEAAAAAVSARLPGAYELRVERVNPFTGSPVCLRSVNAASDAASRADAPLTDQERISRALEHLRMTAPALGYQTWETPEFVPDPHVKTTGAGVRVVTVQQHCRDIPIFQMERAVSFDQTGTIREVTGRNASGLQSDLDPAPVVTVEEAAVAAIGYLAEPDVTVNRRTKQEQVRPAIEVGDYQPRVLSKQANPAQSARLDRSPFGEVTPAHLVWFYQGPTTRLGWHLLVTLPALHEQYAVIIEADVRTADRHKPQPLYCCKVSCEAAARGNVWVQSPGLNASRQLVDFPRALADYPIAPLPPTLPGQFPPAWTNTITTSGNNVMVFFGQVGTFITTGTPDGETLVFNAEPEQGPRQLVLNAFYFCNFMHDFFYLLGFDEAAGNFQAVNLTGQGVPGDNLIAVVVGAIPQTAVMLSDADGVRAIMNLGAGEGGHSALDADIVFHEYAHGVSNRRVGRRGESFPLQMPQSAALGEGWSDYFALTIQNCLFDQERTSFGDWVFNKPPGVGVRQAPYDDAYPATFGKLGQPGPYDGTDTHTTGEIWCATLMKMNRDLGREFGDKRRGHLLGWRIVFDGFSKLAANPNFLQARDGILSALDAYRQTGALSAADFRTARKVAWKAFARFGMGPNARCRDASLEGIFADENLPPGL